MNTGPITAFFGRSLIVTMSVALGLGNVVSANAQEADDGRIEEIIVTGSRIPRTGFETLQPATVLDREQLELRGSLDIAKALNEQAGFVVPTNSPIGGQGRFAVGQNIVNFLGLGQQRTLTLVNGQRFPASGAADLSVDLNAIPEMLVDRVETIAVGGAPIYGSDAIAGTINVILRDDFEGLEFLGSVGTSPEFGDAGETRFVGTWGNNFDNGRGNIAVTGQVVTANGLKRSDRPATATRVGFEAPANPNSPFAFELFNNLIVAADSNNPYPLFFGNRFLFNVRGNGVPLDINDPNSPISQFDGNGNLIPFVPGGGTGSIINQDGGDGLKLAETSSLYADLDRYNANVFLNFHVNDVVNFRAEGWFSRTDATEIINQPRPNSPAFGGLPANGFGNVGSGPIPVLLDNPFLTDATRGTISAALDIVHDLDGDGAADPTIDTDGDGVADAVGFWRGGTLADVMGNNPSRSKQNTYRAIIGFDGDISFGGRDYRWDATYAYGRVEIDDVSLAIIQPNFEQAVQVVTDAAGDPACADALNGCVPLNVVGAPTREAIDFVSALLTDETVQEQKIFSANIGGELFDLPAGSFGAAAGVTYREEGGRFDPNDLSEGGLTRFPVPPASGGFSSTEFYLETVLPLLGGDLDAPFVDTLEFEGAVRFVDNSVAGNDKTWTAGLRYRPIPEVEFRGNFTESIRAPSVFELFLPEITVGARAADPCDARFIDQGNAAATRAANCAADGITQPFQSFIVNAGQQGTSVGNLDLVSEVAESSTFGVVLRPRSLEGFTASIDWFDIEIGNAIENLNLNDIMTACYDSSNFASEPACGLFTRDATGQVADFRQGFVNVSVVEFVGLQTVVNYNTDLGRFGDLSVTVSHLFTEKHLETPGSDNTVQFDGEIGESEHRITASATWSKNKWTWFNQFRWLDNAVFDQADDEFTRNVRGIDDWLIIDSGVGYELNDHLNIQLNIDNLFDVDPPFAAVAVGRGVSTYYAGVLGRYARLQARFRF